MFLGASEYVADKFADAAINDIPYPHIQIDNIFPQQMYQQMLVNEIPGEHLKTLHELQRVGSAYPESRKVLSLQHDMPELADPYRLFWEQAADWLLGPFYDIVIDKFHPHISRRFNDEIPDMGPETLYTQDSTTYNLGPHTDSVKKVITLLIYMPKDDSLSHLGTSMYIPTDKQFTCEGGPHHKFDRFTLLKTAPFKPNTLFGFFKTSNSFHGVEPIQESIRRDLLIYDIQLTKKP